MTVTQKNRERLGSPHALRVAVVCFLSAVWMGVGAQMLRGPINAAEPLRVCLVATDVKAEALFDGLTKSLESTSGVSCVVSRAKHAADGRLSLEHLRQSRAAVFYGGPGHLAPQDIAILQEYLHAGNGSVFIGALSQAWAAIPGFFDEFLGAEPGELFAQGAPMRVINLFPHPIYTGIGQFETEQAMPAYQKVADDLQMIMEGTVNGDTTPLAWVLSRATGRVCHLVPADPGMFMEPTYQRFLVNAALWVAGRPIPNAVAHLQRTIMPGSHPGSFAITFPNGPSVCFDPVRGGINYVWNGDFVDLRPRWLTKQGEPARIFGPVFYRENLWRPLRSGVTPRETDYHFRGYALRDGCPEFHSQVGDREVFERLSASDDGATIIRHFRVGPGGQPLRLSLEPQNNADIRAKGLVRDGDSLYFASPEGGTFTIEITRREKGSDR